MPPEVATATAATPDPRIGRRRHRHNKPPEGNALQKDLESICSRMNADMRIGAQEKIERVRRALDGSAELARDEFKTRAEKAETALELCGKQLEAADRRIGDQDAELSKLRALDAAQLAAVRDALETRVKDAIAQLDGLDVSAVPGDVQGALGSLRKILAG